MKEKLLISACLLGTPCRYDGASKPCDSINSLADYFEFVPICPECDGGLSTPREPSEVVGDRVVNFIGADVTAAYTLGAEIAVKTAIENDCRFALLKARSPSCGNIEIYDGTFSKTLIKGSGVTAKALIDAGIAVYNEEQTELLLFEIK